MKPSLAEAPLAAGAPPSIAVPALASTRTRSMAWLAYAVLFASISVIAGVIWDISWHRSIGRDTFWSPPHLAIYLGGIIAGLASGAHVLRVTFRGSTAERLSTVGFWGFRGLFAAWLCIWGALAMLTSAPFDDWWHGAYGLDVKVLSPPHAVLAAGIWAIQLGAMLLLLALQNREAASLEAERASRQLRLFRWMFVVAAGLVLLNVSIMAFEQTFRIFMHNSGFYVVCAAIFPVVLVAAARAGQVRWPATATAAVYMGFTIAMSWILQLVPAEPMLAPILNEVTRMVPPFFPLLLVVPALGIDLVMRRWKAPRGDWLLAGALGIAFLVLFLPAQWVFADFLASPYSRNWIFATHKMDYMVPPTSAFLEGRFILRDPDGWAFAKGIATALVLGVLSCRLGLAWGRWMQGVRR